jgi:hypothetical protein
LSPTGSVRDFPETLEIPILESDQEHTRPHQSRSHHRQIREHVVRAQQLRLGGLFIGSIVAGAVPSLLFPSQSLRAWRPDLANVRIAESKLVSSLAATYALAREVFRKVAI